MANVQSSIKLNLNAKVSGIGEIRELVDLLKGLKSIGSLNLKLNVGDVAGQAAGVKRVGRNLGEAAQAARAYAQAMADANKPRPSTAATLSASFGFTAQQAETLRARVDAVREVLGKASGRLYEFVQNAQRLSRSGTALFLDGLINKSNAVSAAVAKMRAELDKAARGQLLLGPAPASVLQQYAQAQSVRPPPQVFNQQLNSAVSGQFANLVTTPFQTAINQIRTNARTAFSNVQSFGSQAFNTINSGVNKAAAGISTMFSKFTSLLFSVRSIAFLFLTGLGLNHVINLMSDLLGIGLEFNKAIENAKIGIAALIVATSDLSRNGALITDPNQQFDAAIGVATELIEKMKILGLNTSATTTQLVEGLQQATAVGATAGIPLEKLVLLTTAITNAAPNFGVKLHQINEEIRNLISGTATANTRIANFFGGPRAANTFVKSFKDGNALADALLDKLGVFLLAGQRISQTFEGSISNVREALENLFGKITEGLFDQLRVRFSKIVDEVFTIAGKAPSKLNLNDLKKIFAENGVAALEISEKFKPLVEQAKIFVDLMGGSAVKALDYLINSAADFGKWLEQNNGLVEAFYNLLEVIYEVFREVGALLGTVIAEAWQLIVDLASALGIQIGGAKDQTNVWVIGLRGVAVIIAAISDGVSLVRIGIVGIVDVVKYALLGALELVFRTVLGIGRAIENISKGNFSGVLSGFTEENGQGLVSQSVGSLAAGRRSAEAQYNELARQTQEIFNNGRTAQLLRSPLSSVGGLPRFSFGLGGGKATQTYKKELEKDEEDKAKKAKDATIKTQRQLLDAKFNLLKAELEKERALLDGQLSAQLTRLRDAYDDQLISVKDYYAEKFAIDDRAYRADGALARRELSEAKAKLAELQGIAAGFKNKPEDNKDRVQAETEVANARAKVVEYEKALIELRNKRDAAIQQDLRAAQEVERTLNEQAKELQATLAEISNPVQSASIRAEAQYARLRQQAEVNGYKDIVAAIDKIIEKTEARAVLEKQLNDIATIEESLSNKRLAIQTDVELGLITEQEGKQRILAAEQSITKELERQLILAREQALANNDVARVQQIEAKLIQIRTLGKDTQSVAADINKQLQLGLEDFFASIISGTKGIKQAVADLARSILSMIAKLAAQALVMWLFKAAFGAGAGAGGGGFGGFLSGAFGFGGGKAKGGLVTGPGTSTSDSILTPLSNGEWVVDAATTRRLTPSFLAQLPKIARTSFSTASIAGGIRDIVNNGGRGIKIINALDPDLLDQYMATGSGERRFMNWISRNRPTIKQVLS